MADICNHFQPKNELTSLIKDENNKNKEHKIQITQEILPFLHFYHQLSLIEKRRYLSDFLSSIYTSEDTDEKKLSQFDIESIFTFIECETDSVSLTLLYKIVQYLMPPSLIFILLTSSLNALNNEPKLFSTVFSCFSSVLSKTHSLSTEYQNTSFTNNKVSYFNTVGHTVSYFAPLGRCL